MRWHGSEGKPPDQLHRRGVINIDLISGETIDSQPFAVRTEAELVWIGNRHAGIDFPTLGVKEEHLIASRVAHKKTAVVGSECQMVGFPKHGDPLDLDAPVHIDETERGFT